MCLILQINCLHRKSLVRQLLPAFEIQQKVLSRQKIDRCEQFVARSPQLRLTISCCIIIKAGSTYILVKCIEVIACQRPRHNKILIKFHLILIEIFQGG